MQAKPGLKIAPHGSLSGVRKRVVFQKGGFGGCSPGTKTGTRVRSPKPPFWKPPLYLPMTLFGVDKRVVSKRGGFGGCSPGTKTGTRVHSPKPPFYETALLSPSEVYKLGSFLLNLKVFSVEILQKEGGSLILNFWPPGNL